MNLVYKITFTKRKAKGINPHLYIGSKTNCTFDGKNIIDRNGNVYIGSSMFKGYKEIAKADELLVEILFESDSYDDTLQMERDEHIKNNVKLSELFFNQSIATICTYTHPDYKTMKNINTGKTCRLSEDEITEDWVGVTTGFSWYTNGEKEVSSQEHPGKGWKKGRLPDCGNYNNFYKNGNEKEIRAKGAKTRKENGNYIAYNKGQRGVFKHSEESKAKMKLRPKMTGEKNGMFGKIVINNGEINARITKDDIIPDGWVKGMLKKKRTSS